MLNKFIIFSTGTFFITSFFISVWPYQQLSLSASIKNSAALVSETNYEQIEFPFWGETSILSPDKKFTVFIRVYPETNVADEYKEYGHIPYDEIWIKDNDSGEEKILVKTGEVSSYSFSNSDNFPFSNIYGLQDIIFSLDGKRVYFSSYAWSTSAAIFSVEISTGKLHFVSAGNSPEVISGGLNKGNLIVSKHRYYNYGSYDHYYVIEDNGKEIKDLGDANDNYSSEDCENYYEAEVFEKPIPIAWTATQDDCIESCWGASFTRVPDNKEYSRFVGHLSDSSQIPEKFLENGLILKVSGHWTGIDADHSKTVFENKCVPIVDIDKIEIVK